LCRRCGGAFWGTIPAAVNISLAKGVFVVAQEAGAREVQRWTHRYRIERGRVRLIGLDFTEVDRGSAGSYTTSTNYLTGKTITTIEGDIEGAPQAGTTKGKPRTIFLENVDLARNP
jgi:hypothetical protein